MRAEEYGKVIRVGKKDWEYVTRMGGKGIEMRMCKKQGDRKGREGYNEREERVVCE